MRGSAQVPVMVLFGVLKNNSGISIVQGQPVGTGLRWFFRKNIQAYSKYPVIPVVLPIRKKLPVHRIKKLKLSKMRFLLYIDRN